MTVIVYAQDLSGRNNHGHYTKDNMTEALDIFFVENGSLYRDPDGDEPLSREDAESTYQHDGKLTFYNEEGEKVMITIDRIS